MRTTLTLDRDVAALLERVRIGRRLSLKEVMNDALRKGLRQLQKDAPGRTPYQTPTVSLGACLVGSLDDVSEVLAVAEGDGFK